MIQLFYGGFSFQPCRSVCGSGLLYSLFWGQWILVLSLPERFLPVLLVKLVSLSFLVDVTCTNRNFLLEVSFGDGCTEQQLVLYFFKSKT